MFFFFFFDSLLPLFYELFKFAPCNSEWKNGPILPTQVVNRNSGFALFYFVPGGGCSSDLINTVTELPNQQYMVALDWLR